MTDDIAMCFGSKCPLRRKCRRFAESCDNRGKYAVWTVERYGGGKCDNYLPYKGGNGYDDRDDGNPVGAFGIPQHPQLRRHSRRT